MNKVLGDMFHSKTELQNNNNFIDRINFINKRKKRCVGGLEKYNEC